MYVCMYVFSQEGEEIHRLGPGIGEFIKPHGIALEITGRIVVGCGKDTACLQFFKKQLQACGILEVVI